MLQYPRKNERDQVLRTPTNQSRESSRSNSIGSWATHTIRKANAATNRDEVDVQVVVHQIELLAWSKRTSGSINLAWPFRIGGIIRVFPDLTVHDEDGHFQSFKTTIRTIWNWGKMNAEDGSVLFSAPLSRNTTTRFPEVIISPKVGQSSRDMTGWGGTYVRFVIPGLNLEIDIKRNENGHTGTIKHRFPDFVDGEVFGVGEYEGKDFVGVAIEEVLDILQVLLNRTAVVETL